MDVPCHAQARIATCVLAGLRMVFAAYGVVRSAADVSTCCQPLRLERCRMPLCRS